MTILGITTSVDASSVRSHVRSLSALVLAAGLTLAVMSVAHAFVGALGR
jgi:hypothetical protein